MTIKPNKQLNYQLNLKNIFTIHTTALAVIYNFKFKIVVADIILLIHSVKLLLLWS